MPGWCGAALVMAAVVTLVLFPAVAARILRAPGTATP
jgi:hypothetical protein